MIIHGYIREAGGGVLTIVVDRDTASYPDDGSEVTVIVADGGALARRRTGEFIEQAVRIRRGGL